MSVTLIIGSLVGALIGAVHARDLFRRGTSRRGGTPRRRPPRATARAAYYGLWALVLWTLFGSYILHLWLVAAVIYGCRRVVRRPATPESA